MTDEAQIKKIFVLKEYFNDYDQHGGYYLATFNRPITEKDLAPFDYEHIGRKSCDEYSWLEVEEDILRE